MADNDKEKMGETCDMTATDECNRLSEMMVNSKKDKNEKKLGLIKSFRESFRRSGVISPLSQKKKVVTDKLTNMSDSHVPALSNDLKKQESETRSEKETTPKNEQLDVLTEDTGSSELIRPEIAVEAKKVKHLYTLPKIPEVPLSVMQINKLIKDGVLDEGYVNLRCLEQEVQHELEALGKESSTVELAHKEKDLSLLYKTLKDKITEIVRHSCTLPSPNEEQLVNVACIIQEEKKRGDESQIKEWRDVWKNAVKEGVNDTLKCVHLDTPEQKPSWLAVHLGLVGKVIVEDLMKVKTHIMSAYPPSFNVFDTHVSFIHECVGEHLKGLLAKVTELKDFFALLDFINNRFSSEKIMGNKSLQPELKEEQKTLHIDRYFKEQTENAYCKRLQADVESSLNKIIELEQNDVWKNPEFDDEFFDSQIHTDIWTNLKGKIQGSSRLGENMEQKVLSCCLDKLKPFPKRFESAFVHWNSDLVNPSLQAVYHISYINSFTALKQPLESYKERCPGQVQELERELDGLIDRLRQSLMECFKTDTKNYLRRMMTRKWLTNDDDFQQLLKRIETLSQQCKHMSSQHSQVFVSDVHFYIVREYISQLMKNNYSCKNRKNERAASKIEAQWGDLCELSQEMNSTNHWLYPVGNHLSKIIGETKKSEIKNCLQPLINDYPDFSKTHLSAILYFRGIIRGHERQVILQNFSEMKRNTKNVGRKQHALFTEIKATANTDCLSRLPFLCLSVHDR